MISPVVTYICQSVMALTCCVECFDASLSICFVLTWIPIVKGVKPKQSTCIISALIRDMMNDIYATTSPQNQQWDEIISRLSLNDISKQFLVYFHVIHTSAFLRRLRFSEVFIISCRFFNKNYLKPPWPVSKGFRIICHWRTTRYSSRIC